MKKRLFSNKKRRATFGYAIKPIILTPQSGKLLVRIPEFVFHVTGFSFSSLRGPIIKHIPLSASKLFGDWGYQVAPQKSMLKLTLLKPWKFPPANIEKILFSRIGLEFFFQQQSSLLKDILMKQEAAKERKVQEHLEQLMKKNSKRKR